MHDQPGHTTLIQGMLQRLATGDEQARDDLIAHSVDRLRRLARKMLRENIAVRRWNETDDVLQNALVRLHRSLSTVHPENPRSFINLAATQIRRELIDLWRHHYGPEGDAAHHVSDPQPVNSHQHHQPLHEGLARETESDEIGQEEMVRFHEAVTLLHDDLREVFMMTFYEGLTQQEIADLIGVSTKTVKRRWRDARLSLQSRLSPDSGD